MQAAPAAPSPAADRFLRLLVWGGAALLLALPWIAMRFSNEVQWDAPDFIVFGAMLLAACGACELALRVARDWPARLGFGVAIGSAFLTVWANLAVGLIGSEDHPANLLFGVVLLVAATGAVLARGRPGAMRQAMRTAALAQVLATALALAWAGLDPGVVPALALAAAWLLSAQLFAIAARRLPAGDAETA